ncbi:hypothetical protein [Nitrosopumilus adriaticus]|uniref:Uncharacterized protein n=1 Tax=Nitrosopumilus adriaticus TaxID=1580092 RepID=A0A0D5C2N4_9ARCH|nr:hypothetical protein [Nitrosopumilus adriaticus]AJW71064.1 hypothetical protein NADRNF5_1378 [Nitrosopumilus adriaticus]
MSFYICTGKSLRVFINIENFLSDSIKLKFFLIFKESINKKSFKLDVNLSPNDDGLTLTKTIIIKEQFENFKKNESLGVIKIRSSKINKDFNLPEAICVSPEESSDSYLGAKVTLTNNNVYVQYRK